MAAVTQRAPQRVRGSVISSRPAMGGGGGSGLSTFKGFGGDDGSYSSQQSKANSLRGAVTTCIDKLSAIKNPYDKTPPTASQTGAAIAFAKAEIPTIVANSKKFYEAAQKASDADAALKGHQINFAKHRSITLVQQQGLDHEFAQQQAHNSVATASQQWQTDHVYAVAQASIDQLAKSAAAF